jgi:hypothetical protein
MLRGRCTYAISERPTLSPAIENLLTPLFPLDTSHSPVTPLFPLDTRNRGVHPPSDMTIRPISEFSPRLLAAAPGKTIETPAYLTFAASLTLLLNRKLKTYNLELTHPPGVP